MNVTDLIERVAGELIDPSFTFWRQDEHLNYLNDALAAILVVKPEVARTTEVLDIKAGLSRVSLPGEAYKLLSVNQVADIGVQFIEMAELDRLYPNWRTMKDTPSNWTKYDDEDTSFWLFPVPDSDTTVDVDYSRQLRVNAVTDRVPLNAIYEPMLMDFMLYRAYSKNAHSETSVVRANHHLRAFELLLKGKSSVDAQSRQYVKLQ